MTGKQRVAMDKLRKRLMRQAGQGHVDRLDPEVVKTMKKIINLQEALRR